MESRMALLRLGLGPSVLTLACASALAAISDTSGNPPASPPELSRPRESAAPEMKVVVVDPRHPAIRIELPASEARAAGEDVPGLYRRLVRGARAESATVAVVENGRVFFRRSGISTLALAVRTVAKE